MALKYFIVSHRLIRTDLPVILGQRNKYNIIKVLLIFSAVMHTFYSITHFKLYIPPHGIQNIFNELSIRNLTELTLKY